MWPNWGGGSPSTNTRLKEMPMKQREPGEPGPASKLRAPGFHTTAQTPRTPEQRDT